MSALAGILGVLVRLAGVEDAAVVEQLHVAGAEVHLDVERGVVGDRLEQRHRLELAAVSRGTSGCCCASRMYQPR